MEVLYLLSAAVRQPSRPYVLTECTRGKGGISSWSEDDWVKSISLLFRVRLCDCGHLLTPGIKEISDVF